MKTISLSKIKAIEELTQHHLDLVCSFIQEQQEEIADSPDHATVKVELILRLQKQIDLMVREQARCAKTLARYDPQT